MHIDYVRVYQEEGEESITCDPRQWLLNSAQFQTTDSYISAGWPTTEYIENHPEAYTNANLTVSLRGPY